MPPSSREMATIAERGAVSPPSGKWLSPRSPGCWMPTKTVVRSALHANPVTSHCLGPTIKRRISPVSGSPTSIWLLPCPAKSPSFE